MPTGLWETIRNLQPYMSQILSWWGRLWGLVSLLVRFDVNIHNAHCTATNRVLHVSSLVHGLVSTKGLAICPVLLLVTDCHVISVVRGSSPAATSVQDFVARRARKVIAINAP